ncbi:MAG: HAD-IA family hydrolase [Patescibacteria group bacterium]|nr:HAD-IA family hydrolase [Patescibacteria group bacterium]
MKIKPKIKHLIFDFGGVIVTREPFNFSKFDRKFDLEEGTIKDIVSTFVMKKSIDSSFDEKTSFQKNFSYLLSWKDYEEILEKIYKTEGLNQEIIDWIQEKKKECKISLLTNNSSDIHILLKERFEIEHIFDYIFVSGDIGLAKPDPEIFKYTLKNIRADAKECLFIDDSMENIESAKKLGFSTILFIENKDFFEKVRLVKI